MLKDRYPYYLANEAVFANEDLEVTDKYTLKPATRVAQADDAAIDRAARSAVEAEEALFRMPPYARQQVLYHCIERIEARAEAFAKALCVEAGKPIRDARGEVTRLVDTFRIAAEECVRIYGEVIPLEISARAKGYRGQTQRVPAGACSFISPFNFPLNLVAHKIAPAIAVGCPFVLKPASWTPVGALQLGEILAETDLPKGAFSILPCPREHADRFVTDERFKHLSFTGSPEAGWDIKARCGKKKVTLELGGNAAVVVDEGTDVNDAVSRILIGAFYQSGQSCISVQRIIAHESLYDALRDRLVEETSKLVMGDPGEEATFIGPVISEKDAARIESWIRSAEKKGAEVLCGGKRDGVMVEATLLEGVPRDEPLYAKEVFGPVAVLSKFSDYEAALDEVNDSTYGLQAGVFTRDIYKIQKAWDTLRVGGVVIGEIPSWRVDHMPYGGVKNSGLGREGIRYAMEDMTELRLLVVRDPSA